jgi:hypothetical protein
MRWVGVTLAYGDNIFDRVSDELQEKALINLENGRKEGRTSQMVLKEGKMSVARLF